MLYNPNQGKTEKDISLSDFIGWLETKDPKETYDYQNKTGQCCLGQYMAARGVKWSYPDGYRRVCLKFGGAFRFQKALGQNYWRLGDGPLISTFGAALKRVKRYQKENA